LLYFFKYNIYFYFFECFKITFLYPPRFFQENEAISYIKDNCEGEYIYAGPFIPGFYFETKKLNPIKYSVLITDLNTKEHFSESKEQLKDKNPYCAVLNYAIVKKFDYNKNNEVDNYIFENYEKDLRVGDIIIMNKKNYEN